MDKPRRLWPVITAALLISLPVLYVVSFGPACWYTDSVNDLGVRSRGLKRFYHPLLWVAGVAPEWAGDLLVRYGDPHDRIGNAYYWVHYYRGGYADEE